MPKFPKWVNEGHNKQRYLTFTPWFPDQMIPLSGTLHCMHNDRWFNVYSGEWHPILTGCYFQLHSRGYSSASSGWQLLDSVVCAGRDRSKDCGPLLYLFCRKVGPWSKELICRISCSLSPQLEVVAETLGARKANP